MKKTLYILLGIIVGSAMSVSAASIIFPGYGGTGTGSVPSYGQVLVGNPSGTYTLTATSSLGIGGSSLSGGSPNALTFWLTGSTLGATSSPTVGFLTATTTATSSFAGPVSVATTSQNALSVRDGFGLAILNVQTASTTGNIFEVASTTGTTLLAVTKSGHIATGSGSPTPVISTCGTSPSVTGTDRRGVVTLGSGTPSACTMTFGTPYNTAPICVIKDSSSSIDDGITSISNTVMVVGFGGSFPSGKFYYICEE